jgi:hypothetical protein
MPDLEKEGPRIQMELDADKALVYQLIERQMLPHLEAQAGDVALLGGLSKKLTKPYAKDLRKDARTINEVIGSALGVTAAGITDDLAAVQRMSTVTCEPEKLPAPPAGWEWRCQPTS